MKIRSTLVAVALAAFSTAAQAAPRPIMEIVSFTGTLTITAGNGGVVATLHPGDKIPALAGGETVSVAGGTADLTINKDKVALADGSGVKLTVQSSGGVSIAVSAGSVSVTSRGLVEVLIAGQTLRAAPAIPAFVPSGGPTYTPPATNPQQEIKVTSPVSPSAP